METTKADDTNIVWHYVYDNNGNRLQQLPGDTPIAGAVQYTYNQSNQLVQVETHDGRSFQLQAEMVYDGMGNRLQAIAHTDGSAITATYTLDPRSGLPLIVDNGINVTMILYGQVAIGEYASSTTEWAYYLGDAQLSVRQLVDESGIVTQVQTYGPYGVLLHQAGDGGGLFGYQGGQSAANDLWYFGDGYFDPNTGQFLSRDGNPLLPLAAAAMANPGGFLLVPVLFINWRRRKKGKGRVHPTTLLLFGVLLAVGISGCTPTPTPIPGTPTPTPPPTGTSIPEPTVTVTQVSTPTSTATVVTIAATPTLPNCPTPTQPPSPTPSPTPIPTPLVAFAEAKDFVWTDEEMAAVRTGAWQVANALFTASGGHFSSAREAFLAVYSGTVTFEKTGIQAGNLGEATSQTHILVNEHKRISITSSTAGAMWAAHELGHAFNYALSPNTTDNLSYGQGIIDLALEGVFAVVDDTGIPKRIAGNTTQSYANDNYYVRTSFGYREGTYSRNGGPYQQNPTHAVSEDFADMFMNWAFDSFADNKAGDARYEFMDSHMSTWISLAITNNQ